MTTNRLRRLLRTYVAIAGFSAFFLFGWTPLNAQITFHYSGPLVFSAQPDCSRSLQSIFAGNMPTATSSAGPITMLMYDQANSAPNFYTYTDQIPAPFTITVAWFVKDAAGNTGIFTITGIQIVDNTPPTFDLSNHPPNLSFNSSAQVPQAVWPPFSDNCGFANPPDTMFTQSGALPPLCSSGTVIRTWKVRDVNNNLATFSQTIQIFKDTLPPTVSVFPQNGTAPCSQIPTAYPAWIAAQMANFQASDPSGIKEYTNNAPLPFPPGCTAPVQVRFRAIDNCDLIFPVDVTFSSFDNKPPVALKEPRDTVGYCSAANGHLSEVGKWIKNHGYLQAYDSCSTPAYFSYRMKIGGVERDSAQVVAALLASFSGTCSSMPIGNKLYDKVRGKVLVEFLVKDPCGNEASIGDAIFGVIDTLPPAITGGNQDEECGGGNDQAFLQTWINAHGNATLSDECSTPSWTNFSWLSSDGQSGTGNFSTGPYPSVQANNCSWWTDVTFRAADDCGNMGSKKLRFQIKDSTKPVFAALPNIRVYCPATEPASPLPSVPATDNCDVALTYNFSKQTLLGTCSGNYDVVVTFTATDDCGNTATATQTYEVRDTVRPIFTLVPGSLTFRCDTFVLPAPPVLGTGIMADDPYGCSIISPNGLTTTVTSGKNSDPALCGHYSYPITRTFTVRDDCGNTASASQVLHVVDNLAPTFSGFTDTTIACELPVIFPAPTAADACGSPITPPLRVSDVTNAGPCPESPIRIWVWETQDVCGNKSVFEQTIMVRDTARPLIISGVPPDISVECDAIPAAPLFSTFSTDDNCDASPLLSFAESEIRDPNTANCDHWTNYLLRRQWTVTDHCGNARTYTQNIQVQDNTGPLVVAAPPISLPADQGVCGAVVVVPSLLSVHDICTSLPGSITLRDTAMLLNTSGLPNNQVPVDTVIFQWASPHLPPAVPVVGPATLKVTLKDADANEPTETLRILGEDNSLLGFTTNIAGQCSGQSTQMVTVQADQLNAWLTDGQLTLRLAAKGISPVNNEVNAVCPAAFAYAELTYSIVTQQTPIALAYQLDGGAVASYPPSGSTFLDAGLHTVVYTATDCAGNTTTASTTLTIQDLQPPAVSAPAAQTHYVGQNNCTATLNLPFPAISDNCAVSEEYNKSSAVVPLDFVSDPDAGFIPKDVTLTLTGLVPNAVGNGRLVVKHRGDNAQAGEFFKILPESGAQLATTMLSLTGECNSTFNESSFVVASTLINQWAQDGVSSFTLVANDDAGTYTNFISPCGMQASGPDGTSAVQVMLMYTYAKVDYEIVNATGTPIQSGILNGNLTAVTLPAGNFRVKYSVADINGVIGTTQFNIAVRDTVRPLAKCKDAFINTFPTGKVDTITAAVINNNSTDNCSPNLSYTLSRSQFSCLDIPQNPVSITLTVRDSSGNSSTCTALVKINTAAPVPSFEPACDGGTLKLFANPPATPGGANYTYSWMGPNGYSSSDQNPVISNATKLMRDGTYTVTITGVPGCTATGNVTVALIAPPPKPNLVADSLDLSYCFGKNILLSTTNTGATYEWYEVVVSGPMLLGTTTQPNFTILNPGIGQHQYFVRATGNGCTSQNSDSKFITVHAVPVAQVEAPLVVRCEGESLTLGAVTVPGSVYYWAGPGCTGGNCNVQYPLITSSLDSALHAGFYTLTVFKDGCRSNPSVMEVRVKKKPAKPLLSTPKPQVCEGANVLLISSIAQAAEYRWKSPDQTHDTVTNSNLLNLVSITQAYAGSWRVAVFKDGCESQVSDPLLIEVQKYPDVSTAPQASICLSDTLRLSASADQPISVWAWTGPNGYTSFQQNPVRYPGLTGLYKVVGRTYFGCADSAFVNVIVSAPPQVLASNDAPKCLTGTQTVFLNPSIQSGDGPFTFLWMGPNFISTDSIGLIPNATANQTGAYTLIVKDKYGCPSTPVTTNVTGQNMPKTPDIVAQPAAACPGEKVLLKVTNAADYTGTVTYFWNHVPSGLVVETTVPEFQIVALTSQFAGDYTVTVKVDSCISLVSATALVTLKPKPAPPNISSNSPVCSGQTAILTVQNPQPNFIYFWTGGPGGSNSSNLATWEIPNADSALHSGLYYCRATRNGCTSEQSEGIPLVIHKTPQAPVAFSATTPICLGQNGTLRLEINPGSATSGSMYQWFEDITKMPLALANTDPVFQTNNLPSVLKPGENRFYVVATRNNCPSAPSQVVSIWADTLPASVAFAGLDFFTCDTLPFTLRASKPTVGMGLWELVSGTAGAVIVNPNSDTTLVRNVMSGGIYHFRWTLSAGACKNYSTDEVEVKSSIRQKALSTPVITVCNAIEAQLSATQGSPIHGYWTQDANQAFLNIKIADSLQVNTSVGPLSAGNAYFFYWNIDVPGCPTSVSQTVVRNLNGKPFIGPDVAWCSPDASYPLKAPFAPSTGQYGETSRWYSPDNTLQFTSPTAVSTVVSNLKPGKNIIIWELNGGYCGANSRDTLIIDYGVAPVLQNDAVTVAYGTPVTINVLQNDALPLTRKVFILANPLHGTIDTLSEGVYKYQPTGAFSGADIAYYRVCNFVCPDTTCATASITFTVEENRGCAIPTLITPNGDDLNDQFVVRCQTGEAPTLSVTIFNQWGDEVFHQEPYENKWAGTNSGGEDLPVGTYYVIIDFKDGTKPYAGFLLIQR